MAIMEKIDSPADLRRLGMGELSALAGEIRREIIEVVAKNGGHLAPNLGTVELTLALHYSFDTPNDKLIWDVGHQSYTHKLITGRREQFKTLRTYEGISGFPRRSESTYDTFNTGHSSTSISAALGLAAARDLKKDEYKVIAVIGDGALTAGMAFEGLNQAGHLKRDLVVVLNDNEMSISRNVGALSEYLRKIITTPIYNRLKDDVWELLGKLPRHLSERARDAARRVSEGLKNLVVPTILFEELGFRYIGPLDGHNVEDLIETFGSVKRLRGPMLIHVLTQKGKGYPPAEKDPSQFHGLGSFHIETGTPVESKGPPSYTEIFGRTMIELAEQDEKVIAITAAMPEGTGLTEFAERFPERFFDVGIAEQHAVTFAAGLALSGYRPVAAIYSTFLQRGFDQVIHDVSLGNLPVAFCLDRGGVVGEDGPTHHGAFDLAYLRLVPNMVIMAPKDEGELRDMLKTAVLYEKGPIALRYPRGKGVGVPIDREPRVLDIGRAELLREGEEVVILAIGSMVYPCIEASSRLEGEGIHPTLINARFVKPLDADLLHEVLKQARFVVTVEENNLPGGFGSGVIEFMGEDGLTGVKVLRIGLPDGRVEHGSRDILLDRCGLSSEKIAERVLKFLRKS